MVVASPTRVVTEPVQLKISLGGAPIALHLFERDFVSDIIRRDLYWELPQTKLLARHLKPTDTVLDIGANLGYFTVVAARLARDGVVHAFEPDPDNFALLRRNCALNGCRNVVLHNVALSNRAGAASLHQSGYNMGDHRLAPINNPASDATIALSPGDALLAALPRVDVIKCDTQGSEADVLDGLTQLIGRSTPKPLMLIEFEPLGLVAMGRSYRELLDCFDAWGYRYAFVNWENIFPIDRPALTAIAEHWLATSCGGNLDLVLSPP